MTLERLKKHTRVHGIPDTEVHHWWSTLSDEEKKTIGIASGGALATVALLMSGADPIDAALAGGIFGAYAGLKGLGSVIRKWDERKHKKLSKVI